MDITDATHTLIARYQMHPVEINNGWCWAFAMSLEKMVGGKVVSTNGHKDVFPGHSVLEFNGLFYDAENPEGVKDLKDLSYNKRMQAAKNGDPEALAVLDSIAQYDPRNPY